MRNKYVSLFKDTLLFAVSSFGSKMLTLLLLPLYTNILTVGEYGIVDLITNIVSLLIPILTMSIADATLRFSMEKKSDKKDVLSVSLNIFIKSSLIILPILAMILFAKKELYIYILAFYLIYCLSNFNQIISNYAKGVGNTRIFAFQGIILTLTILISNLLLLLVLNMGVKGYLISYILGYLASDIYILIKGKYYKDIRIFNIGIKELRKKMLSYSIPMVSATIAWWINSSLDKYLLSYMKNVEMNGLYSVAQKNSFDFNYSINIFYTSMANFSN